MNFYAINECSLNLSPVVHVCGDSLALINVTVWYNLSLNCSTHTSVWNFVFVSDCSCQIAVCA